MLGRGVSFVAGDYGRDRGRRRAPSSAAGRWSASFRKELEKRRRAAEAALRSGNQRWIWQRRFLRPCGRGAIREPPTLARRFPVVPGTRPYPSVPPLPVLQETSTGPPPFRDTNIIGTQSRQPRKVRSPAGELGDFSRRISSFESPRLRRVPRLLLDASSANRARGQCSDCLDWGRRFLSHARHVGRGGQKA